MPFYIYVVFKFVIALIFNYENVHFITLFFDTLLNIMMIIIITTTLFVQLFLTYSYKMLQWLVKITH